MSDDTTDTERTHEYNGRTIKIDTGYYSVEVYGDPDDNMVDVLEAFERASDRARNDVKKLNDQMDTDGNDYA